MITVPLLNNERFGKFVDVDAPELADMMVVCVWTDSAKRLVPLEILLLHQLYEQEIERILAEHPDAEEIVCIPASSANYVRVWNRRAEAVLA